MPERRSKIFMSSVGSHCKTFKNQKYGILREITTTACGPQEVVTQNYISFTKCAVTHDWGDTTLRNVKYDLYSIFFNCVHINKKSETESFSSTDLQFYTDYLTFSK